MPSSAKRKLKQSTASREKKARSRVPDRPQEDNSKEDHPHEVQTREDAKQEPDEALLMMITTRIATL